MVEVTGGLTPAERSLRGRLAAHTRWAHEDPVAGTAAARANGPGQDLYWQRKVDPDGKLTDRERQRRAKQAKKAYYASIQLAAAKARRLRAGNSSDGSTAA